jgi:hypothetical protein
MMGPIVPSTGGRCVVHQDIECCVELVAYMEHVVVRVLLVLTFIS